MMMCINIYNNFCSRLVLNSSLALYQIRYDEIKTRYFKFFVFFFVIVHILKFSFDYCFP